MRSTAAFPTHKSYGAPTEWRFFRFHDGKRGTLTVPVGGEMDSVRLEEGHVQIGFTDEASLRDGFARLAFLTGWDAQSTTSPDGDDPIYS